VCSVAAKPEFKVIQNGTNLKDKVRSDLFLVSLWRHECLRVFEDRLVNNEDKKVFHDNLDKVTLEKFKDALGVDDDQLITETLFCDFQREDVFDEYGELLEEAPFVYEAVPSIEDIKTVVYKKMEIGYNEKFPSKKLTLVIFDDALKHLLRLARILNMPRGSSLLVGVGGSGKQSLTKLASYICKQLFFQISLTKSYGEP
jgi:dynein heavy chain